jgi:hypothetical protein
VRASICLGNSLEPSALAGIVKSVYVNICESLLPVPLPWEGRLVIMLKSV